MNKLHLNVEQLAAYFNAAIPEDHMASLEAVITSSNAENAEELTNAELTLLKSNLMNLRVIIEHAGFKIESMALLKKVTTIEGLQTLISIATCEYSGRKLSQKSIDNATEQVNDMYEFFKKTGNEFKDKLNETITNLGQIWFRKK